MLCPAARAALAGGHQHRGHVESAFSYSRSQLPPFDAEEAAKALATACAAVSAEQPAPGSGYERFGLASLERTPPSKGKTPPAPGRTQGTSAHVLITQHFIPTRNYSEPTTSWLGCSSAVVLSSVTHTVLMMLSHLL